MDLTTRYLGLALRNPLIASPSPTNAELGHLKALEDAGIGAVVLPSLFEEQLLARRDRLDEIFAQGEANNPEAQSYLPTQALDGPYGVAPDSYLELIRKAKGALDVPVFASLNGSTPSGWADYAAQIEEAGADGLELNIYYVPVDIGVSGAAIEQRYLDVLASVRREVRIPVVVKMPAYFSSIGNMAQRFVETGANGLVVFNRYLQPDIDLLQMKLSSELELSRPAEMRLSLLWIAVLAGRLDCSLAGSIGVESADQVIKYLLAGADVVMTTSAVMRHGPGHIATLLAGLEAWCEARQVPSLDGLRGVMSRDRLRAHTAGVYERANYIHLIEHYASSVSHR
ncbi:dihydroorotate dehydrogenase-like protein [Halotalea alkalilenta]|uniref:dihydroorotate dehydrogenase-like protein n=1 Tax=Halotalea alkalilenta TaxID=376489 RepID=UPI0004808722|nr:dihydroorotate dehydrogenase-like protein [Halotalea alkalilenta]